MKTILSLLFLILSSLAQADISIDWMSVYKISRQHPVYRSGEPILRPEGTYQLLMALHFISKEGEVKQDCIWYRLPNAELMGLLKVIRGAKECKDWNEDSVWEIDEIRSFSFKLESQKLSLEYTTQDAHLKVLKFSFLNLPKEKSYDLFQSSTTNRQIRGVFFLAPYSESETITHPNQSIENEALCSFLDGSCQRCSQGVISVSDADKPRFKCGVDRCGEKDALACLRGYNWKREREKPTCRRDPWHLYCQMGLRLECEGELGFCR